MENLQNLFDSRNFNELLDLTSETTDYNVLFLRARAYIAIDNFDEAISTFETAVAVCGVWEDCLGAFQAFQEEMGTRIAARTRAYLNEAYNDVGARRLDDITEENFNQAVNICNTYDLILNKMKDALTPICPMPLIMGAVGLPGKSCYCSACAEIWIDAAEKMVSRALSRWKENADAILAEPEYRDATYVDIIFGRISCELAVMDMRMAGKEEYAKNIPQCDRVITLLVKILGTTVYTAKGSMPLMQGNGRKELIDAYTEAVEWRKTAEVGYVPPQIPPQPPIVRKTTRKPATQSSGGCNSATTAESKCAPPQIPPQPPIVPNTTPTPAPQSSGGCYVATAVYGSYDCPQVWTLRRFRDNTLAATWWGRSFIRAYYAISPTLVKWFGKSAWFKNLWKPTLDHMVENLNKTGVEDTPYEDKRW